MLNLNLNCLLILVTYSTSVTVAIQCHHGMNSGNGKCKCDFDYSGQFCQRKMNCAGFDRHLNGTCIKCSFRYRKPDCVWKNCGQNGRLETTTNLCECIQPYSGEFCEELKRENVLHYYNKKVANGTGAIGGLIILPLIGLQWSCNQLARRRKVRRVEKAIEEEIVRRKSGVATQRQDPHDISLDARIADSLLNLSRVNDL